MNVDLADATAKSKRPNRNVQTGISSRRRTSEAGPCPRIASVFVG